MKRIDFIGSPAVGKTTIYSQLLKRRRSRNYWYTIDEAKVMLARSYLKGIAGSVKEKIMLLALYTPLIDIIKPAIADSILSAPAQKVLERANESNRDFLDVALKGAMLVNNEPLYRLKALSWFYNVYKETVICEDSEQSGLVVFDESLSQKVYGISSPLKGSYEQIAAEYFQSIPPPEGLIHFTQKPEEILKRITGREKRNTYHQKGSELELIEIIKAQINIAAIAVAVLQEKRVKIIELSVEQNLEATVNAVNSFIATV